MERPGLFDPQVLLHQRPRLLIQELESIVMGAFISSGLPGVRTRSPQHLTTSAKPGKTSTMSASVEESNMPHSRQQLAATPAVPRLPFTVRQRERAMPRPQISTASGIFTLPTRLMAACIGP